MVEQIKIKKESKRHPIKPKCPACDSMQVLFSKKTGKQWCRVCGHEWLPKENGR